MDRSFSPHERVALVLIALLAGGLLVVGWYNFWYLTDDAYIAFRYVGNSLLGYGYVWNPPPFMPVEGYTSFLWVALLDLVWRTTGAAPPESANLLTLGCSALTLLFTAILLLKVASTDRLRPWRIPILALGLLGLLSNRTFLAWTSSGLDAALFNCLLLAWVTVVLSPGRSSWRWAVTLGSVAALSALTRPDGLLIAGASLALFSVRAWSDWHAGSRPWGFAWGLLPLLVLPLHLLWRFTTYGAWLPNTYFAKRDTTIDRFTSGSRFLLTFVIEYSLWFWLVLALVLAVIMLMRRPRSRLSAGGVARGMVGLTIAAHMIYYTFLIGGDHFEFRVYSHLIPLIMVSFIWMLAALRLRPAAATALLALFVLCSWPIPWTHWVESQRYTSRETTGFLKVSVAEAISQQLPATPAWLLSYLRFYDEQQFWLISHAIGMRHQEHKTFHRYLVEVIPPRGTPPFATGEGYLVSVGSSVGVLAWSRPWANVIDTFGLNDYVIARNPQLRPTGFLAHERQPPPGYLACFAPELESGSSDYAFVSAERIRQCEQTYRDQIATLLLTKP